MNLFTSIWSHPHKLINLPFALSAPEAGTWATTSLHVAGVATIEVDGLLNVAGNFVLTQFDVIGDVAPFGAGATGLALQLSVASN